MMTALTSPTDRARTVQTAEGTASMERFGEVRFERDAGGRIVALTANSDRVRGLRFHRMD
jgi:hypothetical protein